MRVYTFFQHNYPEDPIRSLGFEKFEKVFGDFALVLGQYKDINFSEITEKKIVKLELEEPNIFHILPNLKPYINFSKKFHKILSISRETNDYFQKKLKLKNRSTVFFPFNHELIPKKTKKIYDVSYAGHINSKEINDLIHSMTNFNYCFISNSNSKYTTHRSVSYKEKLELISKSKISIVHNLLFVYPSHVKNLQKLKLNDHPAFRDINDMNLINKFKTYFSQLPFFKNDAIILAPQLKSRVFESAFCKSLILCRKDNFNEIENYFTPEEDFIYYERDDLENKIMDVLSNYSHYKKIVDNAYNKAISHYTVEMFANKYLSKF